MTSVPKANVAERKFETSPSAASPPPGPTQGKARGRTSQSSTSTTWLVGADVTRPRDGRHKAPETCSCAHGVARGGRTSQESGTDVTKLQKPALARTAWPVGTDGTSVGDGRHKAPETRSCARGVARGDGRHKARGRTSQSRWSSRFELFSPPAALERGSRPTRRWLNSHVGAGGRTSQSSKTRSCAHGVARGDGRHKARGRTSQSRWSSRFELFRRPPHWNLARGPRVVG